MSGKDSDVREQLLTHGDDGKTSRDTSFYLYDGDLGRLEKLARSNGFEVHPTANSPGLTLEKTLAVDALNFEPVAAMMARWALETGANYEG